MRLRLAIGRSAPEVRGTWVWIFEQLQPVTPPICAISLAQGPHRKPNVPGGRPWTRRSSRRRCIRVHGSSRPRPLHVCFRHRFVPTIAALFWPGSQCARTAVTAGVNCLLGGCGIDVALAARRRAAADRDSDDVVIVDSGGVCVLHSVESLPVAVCHRSADPRALGGDPVADRRRTHHGGQPVDVAGVGEQPPRRTAACPVRAATRRVSACSHGWEVQAKMTADLLGLTAALAAQRPHR